MADQKSSKGRCKRAGNPNKKAKHRRCWLACNGEGGKKDRHVERSSHGKLKRRDPGQRVRDRITRW